MLDKALEKAADICHMDEKNALLVLYPLPYSGLQPETTLKRVRLVEDQPAYAAQLVHEHQVQH